VDGSFQIRIQIGILTNNYGRGSVSRSPKTYGSYGSGSGTLVKIGKYKKNSLMSLLKITQSIYLLFQYCHSDEIPIITVYQSSHKRSVFVHALRQLLILRL
jgi:hypothetical protein